MLIDPPHVVEQLAERLQEREGPSARALASVWNRLREAEKTVLTGTSIAHLAADDAPAEWTI